MYIEVVFDLPFSQRFTYAVPPSLKDAAQRGVRVLAPFGKRKITGYIVGISSDPPENIEIKQIEDVLDAAPILSNKIMQLAEWIADYYLCGFGEALKATLPAGTNIEYKRIVKLVQPPPATLRSPTGGKDSTRAKILSILHEKEKIRFDTLEKLIGTVGIAYCIRKLEEEGTIQLEEEAIGRAHYRKFEKYLRLNHPTSIANQNSSGQKFSEKQQIILNYLQASGGSARRGDALKATKSSSQALKALVSAGHVEAFERRVERDYYGDLKVPPAPKLFLNKDQQQAVDRICKAVSENKPKTFLIHGVTGSGKTQVYIESIRYAIEANKGAIVLVPEISLTPQAVRRFRSEFQDMVTVVHSKMSTGERYDAWQKTREGRARVVVGPRSAIFSPVQNLGLIVVDEEHEGSYKQSDNAPRYNARDVAVVRAMFENAVVMLGTATPSLESYQNALRGKYELIEMAKRIDDIPMPKVILLNLIEARKMTPKADDFVISELLVQKMENRLSLKEQVIILQNRRGFSTAVTCTECGHVEVCPNCNISLSYHLMGLRMRCHYCELNQKAPAFCPTCRSVEIRYSGIGTQKVELHLKKILPSARIARMDLDTTRGKKAHDKILQDFDDHKYDILIGT
ncbi:MAG: primosomal protein N', partial [bacterium]